ncbi:MAG TPA: molecular chaperone DnaJ, partial [Novosphingobium sp.]|nr:molecular chaperone DnaJ [Novosphingobium sp.]
MVKLLWLVALGCIAWRLYSGRWPWQPKLARPGGKAVPSFEAAQARVLLGVEAGASRREIVDAHRRR